MRGAPRTTHPERVGSRQARPGEVRTMQTQIVHEVVKVKPNTYVVYSIRDGQYVFAEIVQVRHINSSVAEKLYLGFVTKDEMCETTYDGMVRRCYPNKSGDVKIAVKFAKRLATRTP